MLALRCVWSVERELPFAKHKLVHFMFGPAKPAEHAGNRALISGNEVPSMQDSDSGNTHISSPRGDAFLSLPSWLLPGLETVGAFVPSVHLTWCLYLLVISSHPPWAASSARAFVIPAGCLPIFPPLTKRVCIRYQQVACVQRRSGPGDQVLNEEIAKPVCTETGNMVAQVGAQGHADDDLLPGASKEVEAQDTGASIEAQEMEMGQDLEAIDSDTARHENKLQEPDEDAVAPPIGRHGTSKAPHEVRRESAHFASNSASMPEERAQVAGGADRKCIKSICLEDQLGASMDQSNCMGYRDSVTRCKEHRQTNHSDFKVAASTAGRYEFPSNQVAFPFSTRILPPRAPFGLPCDPFSCRCFLWLIRLLNLSCRRDWDTEIGSLGERIAVLEEIIQTQQAVGPRTSLIRQVGIRPWLSQVTALDFESDQSLSLPGLLPLKLGYMCHVSIGAG